MDSNLQHEDLLIKLRGKLNNGQIKLWEPPYVLHDNEISQDLQNLAEKYAAELSLESDTVLQALRELQLHSIERSKANEEFKETGCATIRVKATVPGERPRMIKIQKKLDVSGEELIKLVSDEIGITVSRVKLIVNGKVLKSTANLEEQGVKNGAQVMALIMAESPEEAKKEDNMYMEMKSTRDDAMLLSEYVGNDDEYIKLEDQSGKPVELPAAEKRSLMVGLALHERGRAAAKEKNYPLALVLLLEADRQLSECSSSILQSVDNWAVLQLDIAWSYLCLQSLPAAADAAARLAKAGDALRRTYGENHQRLIALKGTAANERVLFMRLYLLQGIVSYHQNKRTEAKAFLEQAENEMNFLRVDEGAVSALAELGWSRSCARAGLRAASGDLDRAHLFLDERRRERDQARLSHRLTREGEALGVCADGSPLAAPLVAALQGMGFGRALAAAALRSANNHVAEAVRLIQESPELLVDAVSSDDADADSPSSDESPLELDDELIMKLIAMGYGAEEAAAALRLSENQLSEAVDLLVAGIDQLAKAEDPENPSTSSGAGSKTKQKKRKKDKKKTERELALGRLSSAIKSEEDDHLDTSLEEEEQFLAQYKSLL